MSYIIHTFDENCGLGLLPLDLGFFSRGSLFFIDLGEMVDVSRSLFMTYHWYNKSRISELKKFTTLIFKNKSQITIG